MEAGCQPLSVSCAHGRDGGRLPLHHHDPFHWLLIARALVEGLVLATADRVFVRSEATLL